MNKTLVSKNIKSRQVTFQILLQEELVQRCRKNPGYSLRAFARSLQVEPSALSQMINGKRPITENMKLRLGSALGLKIHELEKIPTTGTELIDNGYQKLELDTFAFISDWYHYAILELTYVKGFNADPAWICKRLGITKSECTIAVKRLLRLGLLEETPEGSLRDVSENGELTSLHPTMTSGAARNYQIQLLELSKKSVENDPLEIRNHTSATFCFDVADLEKAVEAIAKFRRKFAKDFQPKNEGNEVYQIQISLFPLTKQKELL